MAKRASAELPAHRALPMTAPPPGAASSRGARTAERLRQGAREAFAELGWQGTRVQDIVSRAGVSHGTFYTYYDNRAAVLADLVGASQAEIRALAAAPWQASDVRGALERVIGGFLDLYQRDAVVMRTWLQAAREEPFFADLYLQSRASFVRRVEQHLRSVVPPSGRPLQPTGAVASSLVAMVEHFAYCWVVLGETHEREEALESLVLIWSSALNALAGFEVARR